MKDQYKYRKKNNKHLKLLLIAFVFLFLFVIFKKQIFSFSQQFEFFQNLSSYFQSKKSMLEESQKIKLENESLKNSKDVIAFYKNKNQALQEELSYTKLFKTERVIFPTFFNSDVNVYNTILIEDKENILEKGDLVFYKYNMLVGKVFESLGEVKKVVPFSAFGQENYFYVTDGTDLKLKLKGIGQGDSVIKVIADRDVEFENQNEVYLSYINNADFLVAKLVEIDFEKQDTNKILYFKIFPNLDLLPFVEVDKKIDQTND
ncbi:hypothetical protein CSB11_02385 [Candidatus Campbellbacteria bacterium]|nr:MAG: hypothetical protein CSB11_02385 [Candidatus Campbellbacteria bacterium]